jgi:hypothetical protein
MAFARPVRSCEYYHYRCVQLHQNPQECDGAMATAMSTGNADIGLLADRLRRQDKVLEEIVAALRLDWFSISPSRLCEFRTRLRPTSFE